MHDGSARTSRHVPAAAYREHFRKGENTRKR